MDTSVGRAMEIGRILAGEGSLLREIRLRALADSPQAFSSSLADAEKRPLEAWEERARQSDAAECGVMFVAVEGSRWRGLVGGWRPDSRPGAVELYSMWVDPERRRSGLGLSLTESVVRWARERGASEVLLWVAVGNEAARTPYRRAGFADTGIVERHGCDEATMMRRAP